MPQLLSRRLDSILSSRGTGPTTKRGTGARSILQRGPILATLLAILIGTVLAWITVTVRESLRELTAESLQSVVSSNVESLRLWLRERQRDAQGLLSEKAIRETAFDLVRLDQDAESAPIQPSIMRMENSLQSRAVTAPYLGWVVTDVRGRVIASNHNGLVDARLPIGQDALLRLLQGRSTVCRPFPAPAAITESGPLTRPGGPMMLVVSPVTERAQSVGGFGLIMDPTKEFSQLLSITRGGRSSGTYAFDRRGTLLSQSRFEGQLRRMSLLDEDENATSVLSISIRDPQANLVLGEQATEAPTQWPLTRMADQATRGSDGFNVDGYNDYRGVPVIGAWRWLPEYEIGVASEIDVEEAFRPVAILRRSIMGLVALAILSAIGLVAVAALFRRLANRLNQSDTAVRRLGQYELSELLGCGGMGSVYRGRHHLLRRDVAIKVLEGEQLTKRSASRFEREVQITARLRHPNTVDIYDYGRTNSGVFFYVMEFIDGITLQQLIDYYGPQSPARVINMLRQVCGSLGEAHGEGLIHRDIKPANLLLTARAGLFDLLKVLDFGLVKEVEAQATNLTRVESLTGTPIYVAPESVRDASTSDHRSDIYSLGAVGYALLCGKPTFDGDSSIDLCMKQLHQDPVPPSERLGKPLPADLEQVLMMCLARRPDQRPDSIVQVAEMLGECADVDTWTIAEAQHWWEVSFDKPAPDKIDTGRKTIAGDGVMAVVGDATADGTAS
ncbi:MAG: protein kinase [Planctomycetota bacterium]